MKCKRCNKWLATCHCPPLVIQAATSEVDTQQLEKREELNAEYRKLAVQRAARFGTGDFNKITRRMHAIEAELRDLGRTQPYTGPDLQPRSSVNV